MSDEVDIADEKQQLFIDAAIMTAKRQAAIDIIGDGFCVVCGGSVEPVELNGKSIVGRWCSVECRRIFENDK